MLYDGPALDVFSLDFLVRRPGTSLKTYGKVLRWVEDLFEPLALSTNVRLPWEVFLGYLTNPQFLRFDELKTSSTGCLS